MSRIEEVIVNKKSTTKIKKIFPKKDLPYETGYISEEQYKVKLKNSLKW